MGQNANLRRETGWTQVTYAKYNKLFVFYMDTIPISSHSHGCVKVKGRCIVQQ